MVLEQLGRLSEAAAAYQRALQLSPKSITVRNAELVRRVHERLKREPAKATLKRLAELHEEGFPRSRVAQLLAGAAALMGEPEPDMAVRNGTVLDKALAEVDEAMVLARSKGDAECCQQYAQLIVDSCKAVAAAAGNGLFGSGEKVTANEKAALDRISQHLGVPITTV